MELARAYGRGGGGKSGGGTTRSAHEDTNTLQSNVIVRVVNLISQGPCVGLVDGGKSIFLDKTAIQAADGSYNFSGITWTTRYGTADQDYIEGFTSSATTVAVNVNVTHATPIIRTLSGPIDAARITVGIPTLMRQDTTNGDLLKTTVDFKISKRVNGTSTWTDSIIKSYTDKCVSAYQESFRIELGGSTDWDIKFERVTADSTDSALQNKTEWAYTTLLADGKFQYPNCGLVSLAINAKLFGSSLPTIAVDWKGLIIKIPANYDPVTRVYTGIWDGTFTTGWTDNPAWVLYALLTDKEDGLGNYISESQVDAYALYDIAVYCDVMVDDGFGGQEPRHTFNYQFTTQMDAYAMIQIVAATFRGYAYEAAGKIGFFADMPCDPVDEFNDTNVIDGLFTYEGTALSARHSVVNVIWFDPDDMCNQAVEVVDDPDQLNAFGWREIQVIAHGCTSRGEANRIGRWLLDTEKNATQTVTFSTSWQGCFLMPGDVFNVCDPSYAGVRLAGRVKTYVAEATSLVTENVVDLSSGAPFTLRVKATDGTWITRTLTNAPGITDTLTFATALDKPIVEEALWGISTSEVAAKQFRLVSIRETKPGEYAITGLEHDPTKYARIETGLVLDPISYTRYSKEPPSAPTAIDYQEYLYKYGLGLKSGITVTITPPASTVLIKGYEVQIQAADGDWISSGEIQGTTADFKSVDIGDYYIRARSISYLGLYGAWSTTKHALLFGEAAEPNDVTNFRCYVVGDIMNLAWDANTDLDLSHYRLRYTPLTSGATWGSSSLLRDEIHDTSAQVSTMTGTILIKAVDLSGTESENAVLCVNTIPPSMSMVSIAVTSDWPTWGGTHTDTEVVDDTVVLSDGELSGTYDFLLSGSGYYDLGSVYTGRISDLLDAYGADLNATWGSFGTWASMGAWALSASDQWSVVVKISTTEDDPAGTPTWTDYADFAVGDYKFRAYRLRAYLTRQTLSITPVLADESISISILARTVTDKNVTSSVSGTAVAFDPDFMAVPSVHITARNMATGDYWEYSSAPTVAGFTIVFKNSSGTAVVRNFDYVAIGYGSLET